jgi:hypothetical protein
MKMRATISGKRRVLSRRGACREFDDSGLSSIGTALAGDKITVAAVGPPLPKAPESDAAQYEQKCELAGIVRAQLGQRISGFVVTTVGALDNAIGAAAGFGIVGVAGVESEPRGSWS